MKRMKDTLLHAVKLIAPVICLIIFFLFIFLMLSLPASFDSGRVWGGYYMLTADSSTDVSALEQALGKAPVTDVISVRSAQVEYYDFESDAEISVSRLDERFDPEDPRFDPFMQRLSQYFSTEGAEGSYNILYVKSSVHPLVLWAGVRRAFRSFKTEWHLLEFSLLRFVLLVSAFGGICGVLIYSSKGFRPLAVLTALPVFILVIGGSFLSFASAVALYFTWLFFMEEAVAVFRYYLNYRKTGRHNYSRLMTRAGLFFVVFAVVLLFHGGIEGGSNQIVMVLYVLSAFVTVSAAYGFFIYFQRERQIHRLFIPVSILKEDFWNRFKGKFSNFVILRLAFLVLLPAAVVLMFAGRDNFYVPRPEKLRNVHSFSWESLYRLYLLSDESMLPDMSDYVSHRAYQETYAYGSEYHFPLENSSIVLSTFSREGDRLVKAEKTVHTFDGEWLHSVLSHDGHGIELLFYSAGYPAQVLRVPVRLVYPDRLRLLRYAIIVFLLFLPFIVAACRTMLISAAKLLPLYFRRKGHEV